MVCDKCEKKLSTLACPDVKIEDARRELRVNENKLLSGRKSASKGNPYANKCKVCKQACQQNQAIYCPSCAYAKGVCSICGKQVLDTKWYKMSEGGVFENKKLRDPSTYACQVDLSAEAAPASEEGPVEPAKKKKKSTYDPLDASQKREPKKKAPVVAAAAPKPKASLPEGWVRVTDEASGQVYYWHTATSKTSWEMPVAEPAKPKKGGNVALPTKTDGSALNWDFDAGSNLHFVVEMQLYYDAKSGLFFKDGQWLKEVEGLMMPPPGIAAQ